MNYVTFETAKRLEAAGFPKTKAPILGDTWYNYNGFGLVICNSDHFDSKGVRYLVGLNIEDGYTGASFHPEDVVQNCYLAPTATNILPELGPNWNLSSYKLPSGIIQYACIWNYEDGETADPDKEFYHENPAECAAMAWLQMNEKK